jgi:uncharacterized membrane protein
MEPNIQNEVVFDKKSDQAEAVLEAKTEQADLIPPKPSRKQQKGKTQYMVTLALLVALTVVLQFVGAMIPALGSTSWSFVLIPIVIGGLVLGVRAGGVLGLAFGIVTVIRGLLGMDALTTHLMFYDNSAINMVLTIVLCIVKAVAAGVIPPLVHRSLKRVLPRGSVWITAALAPIVNTGIFMLGMVFLLTPLAAFVGDAVYFLFFTILVCNFLPELAINLVASPAIYRVTTIVANKRRK